MLAIANDIDGTDMEQFETLHRFLNTNKKTPMGMGLGLDIADSFFMYYRDRGGEARTTSDLGPRTMSYFNNDNAVASRFGKKIRHYIDCGWIDTLHTYGAFDRTGGFQRSMAQSALDELLDQGISIHVWINHGDSNNTQNFDGSRKSHFRGDNPDKNEYHTDLLIDYGVKFVWIGRRDSNRIGHRDAIEPVALWDGQCVWGFTRLCFEEGIRRRIREYCVEAPVRKLRSVGLVKLSQLSTFTARLWHPERLHEQISEKNLDSLVEHQQYSVIAQHLSCRNKLLPRQAVDALKKLKQYEDDGRILVARTSRLLEYNRVSKFLNWDYENDTNPPSLNICDIQDPILGKEIPSIDQLRGITFYVEDPQDVELQLRGSPIDSTMIVRNPCDGIEPSVGVRWFKRNNQDYTDLA